MYDISRPTPQAAPISVAERGALMGKVLGLLGFAFLFTAAGAAISPSVGPAGWLVALVGSLGTLIALVFLRERSPLNLILLYAFATFEGLLLGTLLETYFAAGLGSIVLNAAGATAAIALVAGFYGATTKRDLSGLGSILFIGLIAVVVASLVGIFLHQPLLYVAIAAVSAVLFTGFLVYDLNRVANARGATEGDAIMLAVGIYLDLLNLFLALLRLLSFFSGRND